MALYTKSKDPSSRKRDLNLVLIQTSEEARVDTLESGTVLAIAYTTEDGSIKYLYAPTLVTNVAGDFHKIIGNASNNMDDFRPIALS